MTLRLDMNEKKLFCWLNGRPQPKRTLDLKSGKWFPCVRLHGEGNIVILNPYFLDFDYP